MRFVRLLAGLFVVGLLTLAVVGSTFLNHWLVSLPDYRELDQLRLEGTTKFFARNGRLIAVLAPTGREGRTDRRPVKLDEISPNLVAAVLAGEDEDFFKHYGFDALSVGKSLYETFLRGNQRGGSTITQQLVKNTLLRDLAQDRRMTAQRKIKELLLSVQAERHFTKEEILRAYLNVAFWGGNVAGIRAAAQTYFGKEPINLTMSESLYLSSLIPSPNEFFKSMIRAREGMKLRLTRLVKDEWVTQAEADKIWREPLQPQGWSVKYDATGNILESKLVNSRINIVKEFRSENFGDYFMFEVRRILKEKFPDKMFSGGGLKVYTTMDPQQQEAAEEAVRRARVPYPYTAQVAIVGLDPFTGEVTAMVGGRRDESGNVTEFNRVTQAQVQPGSSIKPLLYATALEKGYNQWSSFLDAPVDIFAPGTPAKRGCRYNYWCPKNFDSTYTGHLVNMRYSLDHSLNLPTIRIGTEVGMKDFRKKLLDLGFKSLPDTLPIASVIGAIETSPIEMTSAYASFVNGGYSIPPQFISRIEDADGRVLFPLDGDEPKRKRVWSPQTAYQALDMICGVVNDPPSISAQYAERAKIAGRRVCGKTGTTNDVKAMWFVGTTPNLTSSVWIGNDNGDPMPESAFSGEFNPPIWKRFVEAALQGKPPGEYTVPSNVAYRTIGGVRMHYNTNPNAGNGGTDTSNDDTEIVHKQTKAEAPDPVLAPEGRVLVPLDTCNSPLKRADETTPSNCVIQEWVRVADLPFYDPNYKPPVYVPAPTGP